MFKSEFELMAELLGSSKVKPESELGDSHDAQVDNRDTAPTDDKLKLSEKDSEQVR